MLTLRELQQQYDIRFKKSLGQNLLVDDNINRILVDAAGLTEDDAVVEVGAGLGALTRRIREKAGTVLSIEIDQAFMPCLEEQFGEDERVRLFRGDILNHDLDKLVHEYLPERPTYKMLSNLPYYITTPVLFHFWESPVRFSVMVVMVQEEVGMRMVAPVGGPDYGVLTLAAQYYGRVDVIHRVPRTCFRPAPNVDSVVVRIREWERPPYPDVDGRFLLRLIRAAFTQRRKTLRNSLIKSGNFGAPKTAVEAAFEDTGIDSARRPQTLALDEFAALAKSIRERI